MTTTDINPFAGTTVIDRPTTATPVLASEKQVAFITKLLAERQYAGEVVLSTIGKRQASVLIDELLAAPRKTATTGTDITDGFWVLGTTVYKVQRAVHGSGNLYAKVLNDFTGRFEYTSGAITLLRNGKAEKLTLERAKELGKLYGRCMICGATLTDEKSIAMGIGPVCGGRL